MLRKSLICFLLCFGLQLMLKIESKKRTSGKANKRLGFDEIISDPSVQSLAFEPHFDQLDFFPTGPCDPNALYRTIDGSCNNLRFPTWGQATSPFIRFLPPDYADGVDAPRAAKDGLPLPSARTVSVVMNQDIPIENPHFTTLFILWGQFINHDVNNKLETKAPDGSDLVCCLPDGSINPDPGCLPIIVDEDDPFYAQFGTRCLQVVRAAAFPSRHIGYRENINNNTAFIDASTIYGSDRETASSLRIFKEGLLQHTSVPDKKPLLPITGATLNVCPSITGICFRSGDFRVNMLPPLTTLHIMLMREHLRLSKKFVLLNPHWGDERIYQETRKIISAMVQHVTYNEYLPLVLSPAYMKTFDLYLKEIGYYKGYEPETNPSIGNVFATAAYRFGHSLIQGKFHRYHSDHNKISGLAPPLSKELREPLALFNGEVDLIVNGMINQRSRERDEQFTKQVTNHLFENRTLGPGSGLDLLAINIHRGRENGIPSYNEWREYCGLEKVHSFEELLGSMPTEVVEGFASIYHHVDDIDLFAAGISEYRVEDGIVGPTFSCIIAQQFKNLRKGDRFWYENGGHKGAFSPAQLTEIRKSSLARLLCDNFEGIETIQLRPMEVPKGPRINCNDPFLHSINLEAWQEFGPYPHAVIQGISQADSIPILRHPKSVNIDVKGPAYVRVYHEMFTKPREFKPDGPPRSFLPSALSFFTLKK